MPKNLEPCLNGHSNKLSQSIFFLSFSKKCTIAWHTQWSYTSEISLSLSLSLSLSHCFLLSSSLLSSLTLSLSQTVIWTPISLSLSLSYTHTALSLKHTTHTHSLSFFHTMSIAKWTNKKLLRSWQEKKIPNLLYIIPNGISSSCSQTEQGDWLLKLVKMNRLCFVVDSLLH